MGLEPAGSGRWQSLLFPPVLPCSLSSDGICSSTLNGWTRRLHSNSREHQRSRPLRNKCLLRTITHSLFLLCWGRLRSRANKRMRWEVRPPSCDCQGKASSTFQGHRLHSSLHSARKRALAEILGPAGPQEAAATCTVEAVRVFCALRSRLGLFPAGIRLGWAHRAQ